MSGKVLWTRHVHNLLGERPGDYAPTLALPAANVVVARTEQGVPNGIDTRTGKTIWEYPGLDGCRTDDLVTGAAGVAVSQRCAEGKVRVAVVNPSTGKAVWKTSISTPSLRLLAVGTNSVVVYQGGLVSQIIGLGPGGGYASQTPCDCGDGAVLPAGAVGGTVLSGGPLGRIGVGGVVLVGGPIGLIGLDGDSGTVRWHQPVAGGPVHKVLTQDGDAHLVSGDGALIRVDPLTGGLRTLISGAPGVLDPDGIVVPVGGYLAAGSAKAFAFAPSP